MYTNMNLALRLAVVALFAAIVVALIGTWGPIGSPVTDKCIGYNKAPPGQSKKSLSAGSCSAETASPVVFNHVGDRFPLQDKNGQCITALAKNPGAPVDRKPCKPLPTGKGRRTAAPKTGKNFTEDADQYDWPLEQQWTKISGDASLFGEGAELWQNGYGLCLQVRANNFFEHAICDPTNPSQQWTLNYIPGNTVTVPTVLNVAPVQQAPVIQQNPVQQTTTTTVTQPTPTGCTQVTCPGNQVQDPTTCECSCPTSTCSGNQVQDPTTCECSCPANTCSGNQLQDPTTCECSCPVNTCSGNQVQDPTTCECSCPVNTCSGNQVQDPTTCECCCPANTCSGNQVQDASTCACQCVATPCPGNLERDPSTCECVCNTAPQVCGYGEYWNANTCKCCSCPIPGPPGRRSECNW